MSKVSVDSENKKKIEVMLADDHPLICLALRKIFGDNPDFEVVAEVRDGEEAVRLATELQPDVVIMDITLPKLNGIEATRQIKAKNPKIMIMVLTVHSDTEHILGVFEAGADGYLTKDALGEEVLNSVRGLVAGDMVLSPIVFKQLMKRMLRYSAKPLPVGLSERLSIREQEILALVARGMNNKEVALQLNISSTTVKTYLVEIFAKLGVNSRTEAVIIGLRSGLLSLDDLD